MQINQKHIVVARRCTPGWYEVVEDFSPPKGDIDYPYMRAAHADAAARASTSPVEVCAFMVRSQIRVGRQFNLSTEYAETIDQSALQAAKRAIGI